MFSFKASVSVATATLLVGMSGAVTAQQSQNQYGHFLTLLAEQKANALGATLQAALKPSLQRDGAAKSIAVCNHVAPQASESMLSDSWIVGRTSTKWRNPSNKPDSWEMQQLATFAEQVSAGVPAGKISVSEIVQVDGKTAFRYMRPIMTKGLCLQCHGAQLSDEVQSALGALYPLDNATGYAEGELRGAFTLLKWLTAEEVSKLSDSGSTKSSH